VSGQLRTSRWDEAIRGEGRGLRLRRKLEAGKERNWLLALTAVACAKAEQRKPLTDLDQHLVNAMRKAHGDDLVRAFAHVHKSTPVGIRSRFFTDRFANLTLDSSITLSELEKMAPEISEQHLRAAHVRPLDLDAVRSGRVPRRNALRLDSPDLARGVGFISALDPGRAAAEHGAGGEGAVASAQAVANRYMIKAVAFRCLEESSEWSASDEVYWLFASAAKGYKATSGTHVFNGVDANDVFDFQANEGCIWGMDCQPHSFPVGDVGSVVTLMEHDEGNPSDVLAAWSSVFTGLSGVLLASGAAAWVGAVVAAIGGIGAVIIGLMADDHVADWSYTYNKATIDEVVGKHGGSYDLTNVFSDGDARYRLRIRIARVV
jgi:hypothetical protein